MKTIKSSLNKNKLKVFLLHTQNSGVGMWRMLHPAKWINKLGLAEVKMIPFYWKSHGYPNWETYVRDCKDKGKEPDPQEFQKKVEKVPKDPFKEIWDRSRANDPRPSLIEKLALWADVIVVMRRDIREHAALLMALKDLKKPVVLETDDFVHYVPPYNPGAKYYVPGSEQTDIWSTRQFELVDAVITTTPGLKKLYTQLHRKIYLCPNMMDPDYWIDKYPEPKPHPGEIRLGWTGANAHWGDLRVLYDAQDKSKNVIDVILNKYPQVNFHFIGQLPEWWYEWKKKGRLVHHRFKTLHYYGEYLRSVGMDIGIAPLVDNLFNRGKSQIRWNEYSVNKTAVVASPVLAYSKDAMGVIKHGKNIFFAKYKEDWIKYLSILIEDEILRKKMADQAYRDTMKFYNLEKQAHVWVKVYQQIYDSFHYS